MKIFLVMALLAVVAAVVTCDKDVDDTAINQKHYKMLRDTLYGEFSPCTQFYSHVCYKWPGNHVANIGNYNSVMEMLNHEANMEIKEYLENTPLDDVSYYYEKMAKNFYESCMKDGKEFDYLKIMHWLEQEENMKWALLTPTDEKNVVFDWISTMAKFRKYGLNDMFVEQWSSSKDTFRYVTSYQMRSYKKDIPLPSGAMDFMALWPLIQEFEQKLKLIKVSKAEEKQTYKFHQLPYDWLKKYLTAVAEPKQLDANMELSIDNGDAMDKLDALIKQYDEAFLCRYLEIRFLLYLENARQRIQPNSCIHQVTSYMTMASEGIYVNLHPELLQEYSQIQQMFENIVKSVNKTLQMDTQNIIPQEYFAKLETMQLQVGDTYSTNTIERLEGHYKDLQLQPNDYHGNLLKIMKFLNKQQSDDSAMEILYKAPTLVVPTSNVMPKYVAKTNVLTLPFGLLRAPFYNPAYVDIFKQSSLGTLMAIHIFDPLVLMGAHNNWDIETFPDMLGLHSSFEVFFSSLERKEIERYQAMFNMTSVEQQLRQLFFINEMHGRCAWFYAPADRVNTMLRDIPYFNQAFECKVNDFLKQVL
ncbi:neprilysin-2-like [Musca autumnalis]|uniref:neprilysin-2-like n=1 Tax=Musca autumnalis TaxID=221902 RepID=UPI003CF3D022